MSRPVLSWLAVLAMAGITYWAGGMTAPAASSAAHTSSRCQHETIRHVTYGECESRTGNTVTYTYTQRQTVHV